MVAQIGQTHQVLGEIAFCVWDYSAAEYYYQQSLKFLADHGGFAHLKIQTLFRIAHLWAAQANKDRAVELLTLILHHSESLLWRRDEVEQMLQTLETQLPPSAFAAAWERGKKLEFGTVVVELSKELTHPAQAASLAAIAPTLYPLDDPLTERELEILHLIADGLSNREIADQLVLAVSTVKWYINEIFGKLHVTNRTQAVAHARELGLLS